MLFINNEQFLNSSSSSIYNNDTEIKRTEKSRYRVPDHQIPKINSRTTKGGGGREGGERGKWRIGFLVGA